VALVNRGLLADAVPTPVVLTDAGPEDVVLPGAGGAMGDVVVSSVTTVSFQSSRVVAPGT
jgi:hypothetical protein